MMLAADDNFSDSLRGLRLPNSLSEKAGTPLAGFLPCAVWVMLGVLKRICTGIQDRRTESLCIELGKQKNHEPH